jgi:hypothetical protein
VLIGILSYVLTTERVRRNRSLPLCTFFIPPTIRCEVSYIRYSEAIYMSPISSKIFFTKLNSSCEVYHIAQRTARPVGGSISYVCLKRVFGHRHKPDRLWDVCHCPTSAVSLSTCVGWRVGAGTNPDSYCTCQFF